MADHTHQMYEYLRDDAYIYYACSHSGCNHTSQKPRRW